MTEANPQNTGGAQAPEPSTPQDSGAPTEAPPERAAPEPTSPPGPGSNEWVPRHRMNEAEKRARSAEARLQEFEAEQERVSEERQKKQGEYQQLADKYKKQLDKEKELHSQTKADWQREKRLNVWSRAAQGVIKTEAIGDAFDMLDEDDFRDVDDQDENSMRRVAEQLAERKPYMSDGPRGAGSGGSRVPILGGAGGNAPNGSRSLSTGKQPILKGRRRRPWK